ncbi:hypothetical protein GN956_G9695 [Arapaima gigas]
MAIAGRAGTVASFRCFRSSWACPHPPRFALPPPPPTQDGSGRIRVPAQEPAALAVFPKFDQSLEGCEQLFWVATHDPSWLGVEIDV